VITNAGALVGKVAANTILPGEQLTANDFTIQKVRTGATAVLAPTERALAVTLDQAHSVAGLVQVGDQVDVYGDTPDQVVGLLIADAVVLEAPFGVRTTAASTTGGSTTAGSGNTYVLGVSDTLSPRVMWMADNGKVWLELRAANATNPAPTSLDRKQVYLGNYPTTTPTYSAQSTGAKR
jgi:Flp pilus assembly protein CpaB